MFRRRFLYLAGLSLSSLAFHSLRLNAANSDRVPRELKADIVIVGAGLGGCAAALAALRAGSRVVLTEETDWIGGQTTSQAVPPDEHPWIESFGCTRSYRSYRDRVREFYRRNYPLTPAARANVTLNPGNGWVSRLCHEPRVSLAVLEEMLAPYLSSGLLTVLLHTRPVAATTDNDRITSVTCENTNSRSQTTLLAPYFIDATEMGDLLPLTQTEYVIGAESSKEHGEPHAPDVAQPDNQQALTVCFAMDYLPGEDHTITKPADYEFWRDYKPNLKPAWPGPLLSWECSDPITLKLRSLGFDPTEKITARNLWTYRRILDPAHFAAGAFPSSICLVNWPQNDYWLAPIADLPAHEVATHLGKARSLSLSLLYWMQTAAPRPDGGTGWKGLRLRHEVVDTEDGLAKAAYIRESRRIRAEFTVVEQHLSTEFRMQETKRPRDEVTATPFSDSVGIGSYRIDLHPTTNGTNYVDLSSLPFQIPLGALIPRRMNNLLAACKNIGSTHITNGALRLHPVEWNIGEAAGALASHCLRKKQVPRAIRSNKESLAEFQQSLRTQGFELEWPKTRPL